MSFWSTLGKILPAAGAIAGAPFTGGMSLSALPGILASAGNIAGAVAPILGSAAKGRGEAQATNEQLMIARSAADTARRRQMVEAPGERMRQASRASLVSSHTPTEFKMMKPGDGMKGQGPSFTGGFNNPNLYTDDTKQLANETIKNHLVSTLNGDDKAPEIPMPGKSSGIDKALGIGGFAGGLLGALAPVFGKRPVSHKDMPPPILGF